MYLNIDITNKNMNVNFDESYSLSFNFYKIIKGEKGDKGDDGLTTSIKLNGQIYEQESGQIDLGELGVNRTVKISDMPDLIINGTMIDFITSIRDNQYIKTGMQLIGNVLFSDEPYEGMIESFIVCNIQLKTDENMAGNITMTSSDVPPYILMFSFLA